MANTVVVADKPKKNIWGGGMSPMKAGYGKLMMWFFLLSDAFSFSGLLVAYGFNRFKYQPYTGEPDAFISSLDYWPIPDQIYDAFPFMHGVHAPLMFVGLMTFILILSSVTMVLAVEAGHRMDRLAVQKWMMWTILGGILFLGCQAWEWMHFIHGTESMVQLFAQGFSGDYAQIVSGAHFENGQVVVDNVTNLALIKPLATGGETVTGTTALELLHNAIPIEGANLVQNEYGPPAFADFFFFITGFHGTHVLSGVILNIIIFYNVSTGLYQRRGHYEMIEKVGLYWHFVDLVWVFVFTFFYLV